MTRARTNADQAHTESFQHAHIIPGVLYPAVADKMLDGTTSLSASTTGPNSSTVASSKYGTVQSDGRMYYYTDIKGSKPIKDPRIGAHFGSQRHTVRSIQLLEQETATHGEEGSVFSVDGREWFRFTGGSVATSSMTNGGEGNALTLRGASETGQFIEIVGYFNQANAYVTWSDNSNARTLIPHINGGGAGTATVQGASANPLTAGNRYVNASSLMNLTFASAITTPGINTLKLTHNNYDTVFGGIELIAQDTTSTANKSKIQIPSQNVVSYGKKFTVSGTPHYNPFATKGDGSASTIPNNTTGDSVATGWAGSTSAYWDSSLDTATSLGLTAWEEGGAFYRPVNGGRVVKWVDSTGTIKTSVNMMPPSAKALGTHSGDATPTGATNWSTQYLPIFSSGSIDHSQAEVAKTFDAREFGNGAANGGTGATYADASMLNTEDDIAYVMDDGLTSHSGKGVRRPSYHTMMANGTDDYNIFTFIGTGITNKNMENSPDTRHIAQNLPYGTHILKLNRNGSNATEYTIDGVSVGSTASACGETSEVTIHQPKKPPIPEEAVVLADYCLFADFVPQTSAGIDKISKGTRSVSTSRDFFIDDTGSNTVALNLSAIHLHGYKIGSSATADSDTTITFRLPAFATNYVSRGYQSDTRHKLFIDTTDKDSSATKDNTAVDGSYAYLTTSETLGVQKWGDNVVSGQYAVFEGFDIVPPTPTSSHYQTFETPFLHELVGGDRNMEQTNLVVTPDGKTWDEVTRDTSYIKKNIVLHGARDGGDVTAGNPWFCDFFRGNFKHETCVQKDIAIAYDRLIFLKSGLYKVLWQPFYNASGWSYINLNTTGTQGVRVRLNTGDEGAYKSAYFSVKRGDYLYINAENGGSIDGTTYYYSALSIEKV